MLKYVIWDFDGTLFNSYHTLVGALKRALADFGHEVDYDEIIGFFMSKERVALDHYREKFSMGDELDAKYFVYKDNWDITTVKSYPNAKEACEAIKAKGAHNYILTHRDHTAPMIIAGNGMTHVFDEVVTTQMGFRRKPDPQGVFYLMEKYGMRPEEVLIVGDRELEINLSLNAGVNCCFYHNGVSRYAPELRQRFTDRKLFDAWDLMDVAGIVAEN